MVGYWNDTLASYDVLRDGWMRTGDLARSDIEGYVWLEGRLKEMIVRDGSNVSPADVETVALAEPGVSAAAAVGLADPLHGEAVHLFITAAADDDGHLEERLWRRLRGQLRPLAIPAAIHRVAALPRNAAGKVDKARLREVAAG
jgi:acyl-coenzyme A synthetase/AMP-(fatty) acid ligase